MYGMKLLIHAATSTVILLFEAGPYINITPHP